MTTLREAAEMAIEALETLWDILDDIDTASDMAKANDAWYRKRVESLQKKRWDTMITTDGHKLKGGPVEALRQALAMERFSEVSQEIEEALKQEPVAWQVMVEDEALKEFPMKEMAHDWCVHKKLSGSSCAYWIRPLYTATPKREWVGLTEDETDGLIHSATYMDETDIWHLVSLVEERLKEKNSC